jgi:D-lyxose ketol-isomerase
LAEANLHTETLRQEAANLIRSAGMVVTDSEELAIEIADFGLEDFKSQGLAILVYVNTDRCCAKELAMWPGQTCPEHRHPPVGDDPGKEETFRCRWGTVYLYVPGEPTSSPTCEPPAGRDAYTVGHEVCLKPGDQYTIAPNTPHWFQAGAEGAVISEFSTHSTDEQDVFTDRSIQRVPGY